MCNYPSYSFAEDSYDLSPVGAIYNRHYLEHQKYFTFEGVHKTIQPKSYRIDSRFKNSTYETPYSVRLNIDSRIYSLGLKGTFVQAESGTRTGLVLLLDNDDRQYIVYRSLSTPDIVNIEIDGFCYETCIFPKGVQPKELKIFVVNSEIRISEIVYTDKLDMSINAVALRNNQQDLSVKIVNDQLKKGGKSWQVERNALFDLTYNERVLGFVENSQTYNEDNENKLNDPEINNEKPSVVKQQTIMSDHRKPLSSNARSTAFTMNSECNGYETPDDCLIDNFWEQYASSVSSQGSCSNCLVHAYLAALEAMIRYGKANGYYDEYPYNQLPQEVFDNVNLDENYFRDCIARSNGAWCDYGQGYSCDVCDYPILQEFHQEFISCPQYIFDEGCTYEISASGECTTTGYCQKFSPPNTDLIVDYILPAASPDDVEEAIIRHMTQYGSPSIVAFKIWNSFVNYNSNDVIWEPLESGDYLIINSNGGTANHNVVVFGFGYVFEDYNGINFYIKFKNSWGTFWGPYSGWGYMFTYPSLIDLYEPLVQRIATFDIDSFADTNVPSTAVNCSGNYDPDPYNLIEAGYTFCQDSDGNAETDFCSGAFISEAVCDRATEFYDNDCISRQLNCPYGCSNAKCNLPPVGNYSCSEFDGGDNDPYSGDFIQVVDSDGNITFSSWDVCSSAGSTSWVEEYYCDPQNPSGYSSQVVYCDDTDQCDVFNNKCRRVSSWCTDSDSGPFYNIDGNCIDEVMNTNGQSALKDYCDNDGNQLESYCDNNNRCMYMYRSCTDGCEPGDGNQCLLTSYVDEMPGWPQSVFSGDSFYNAPVTVGDIDLDGDLELAVLATERLYVWQHEDGPDADNLPDLATYPIRGDGHGSAPVIADIVPGSPGQEIIIAGSLFGNYGLYVLALDGVDLLYELWSGPISGAIEGSPAVGDLDANGDLEVVVTSTDGNIYIWDNEGNYLNGWPKYVGNMQTTPVLVDLDLDRTLEIISVRVNGEVNVYRFDSSTYSGWPNMLTGVLPAVSSPAVGNLDADLNLEIIAAGSDGIVRAWNHDGTLLTGWESGKNTNGFVQSSPALADLDADGDFEVIMSADSGKLFIWNSDGSDYVFGWPIDIGLPLRKNSPVIADMDGDNILEILMGSSNKLSAWNRNTGTEIGWPLTINNPTNSALLPTLADLNGDNHLEIIVAVYRDLYVFSLPSWVSTKQLAWPTLRGNNERTGVYRRNVSKRTGGKACFLAGTSILMANNSAKPIEKVKVGDLITEFDQLSSKLKNGKVIKVFSHQADSYIVVNDLIRVTKEHPLYVNGSWKEAGKLKIGDIINKADGSFLQVSSIKSINEPVTVYNLEANPFHTYVADGVIAHNKQLPRLYE